MGPRAGVQDQVMEGDSSPGAMQLSSSPGLARPTVDLGLVASPS